MLRFVPALRVGPRTFAHAAYLEALAESVREATTALPRPPEKILVSFHGIPQRFVESGDPYASHCEATALSLAARAGWGEWHLPDLLSIPCRPRTLAASVTPTRPSSNWRGTVRRNVMVIVWASSPTAWRRSIPDRHHVELLVMQLRVGLDGDVLAERLLQVPQHARAPLPSAPARCRG